MTGPFCSFYFFLSLYFLQVDSRMLVQVKHRGWIFIQGFYYKNKGRGRVVHTGEGREICKIRMGGKIKFKTHTHNNCFYGREIYPEVRELQCPLQNTRIYTNDLKILYFN